MIPKETAESFLPKLSTPRDISPASLVILMIGPPKWGKTKFMMSNPNALLLATETGHRFQAGHKIEITAWDHTGKRPAPVHDSDGIVRMSFLQAVEILESTDKFDFVIIDTTDMLAKMCSDFHCAKIAVEHPSDAGDFGKGFDLCLNSPFRRACLRIMKTGRGIGFITHSDPKTYKFKSGEKTKKESTLSGGVWKFVYTQADCILHGKFGKTVSRKDGTTYRQRILEAEGSEDAIAGVRAEGVSLPNSWVVDPNNPWSQFAGFFAAPAKPVKQAAKEIVKNK